MHVEGTHLQTHLCTCSTVPAKVLYLQYLVQQGRAAETVETAETVVQKIHYCSLHLHFF